MRNDGSAAEDAFVAIIEALPESHVERFRDAKDLRGLNNGRRVGDFAKPSDFLVTLQGLTSYAEVKSTASMTRFSFADIRPYQKRTAMIMAKIGAVYTFYIFSYGRGEWFIMTARQFADAVDQRRASITFEELKKWVI